MKNTLLLTISKLSISKNGEGNLFEKIILYLATAGSLVILFFVCTYISILLVIIIFSIVCEFSPGGVTFWGIESYEDREVSFSVNDMFLSIVERAEYFSDSVFSAIYEFFHPIIAADIYGALLVHILLLFYVTALSLFIFLGQVMKKENTLFFGDNGVFVKSLVVFLLAMCVFFSLFLLTNAREFGMKDVLPVLSALIAWYYLPRIWVVIGYSTKIIHIIFLLIFFSFFYGWISLESAWWGLEELSSHPIVVVVVLILLILDEFGGKKNKP